ncbi:MAG: diguanylate cyclase [Candidatus Thiodiazotropha lotti]|nr:diguanylate cyclase [Candidatus Thiodiazotropha lotti]
MVIDKSKNFTAEHTAENNQVLSELLQIASKSSALDELLKESLNVLLSLSWLSILPKGGIFLTERDHFGIEYLQLIAEKNLGGPILTLCQRVDYGQCLCGRAAQTKQPVHASSIDKRHETTFEGIEPHGHYNIPILSDNNVLGVLVFYLPDGKKSDEEEVAFFIRAAAILSLIIKLRRNEIELKKVNRELSYEKLALDEHAIVSITNIMGDIVYANDKICKISGYTREELLRKNHRILKSGEHSKQFYTDLWRTIFNGKVWHGGIKNRTKDGNYYWVNATIVPFLYDNGRPYKYVSISTDITAQKNAEETLNQAQVVAKIGNWRLDLKNEDLFWSDQIYKIFGINPNEFEPSYAAFLDTIYPDDINYVVEQYEGSLKGLFPYDIEHRIIRKDNRETRWVHERCVHHRDINGDVIHSDGTVQDITDRKLAQEEIHRLAMTDQLTGLANRNQFTRRFEDSVKLATREKKHLALMVLDLDKFKPVNDTYGHQVGDALLQNVASILKNSCRETDIVARLGGDEFAILLVHPENGNDAGKCAQRIIDDINNPISIAGNNIKIGISIGISFFPEQSIKQDDLFYKADLALYKAKKSGRNAYCIFST